MFSPHEIDISEELRMEMFDGAIDDTRQIENPEIEPVPEQLNDEHYKTVQYEPYTPATTELIEAVNLAIALGRPLLLQGEPGCGKTRLAYAVAYALGMPLEVCSIKSTSRAQDLLYTYDVVKRLYDAQIGTKNQDGNGEQGKDGSARQEPAEQSLDIRNYIHLGPLGRAIARAQYGRRSVVLIDEIDKADLDFPNDLLWELDRLELNVTEVPHMAYAVQSAQYRPIVFVTHNEEKALPAAFLRRCIFYYLEFPSDEHILQTIMSKHRITQLELGKKAIAMLLLLRDIPGLRHKPGLSDLINWVGYMEVVNTPPEKIDELVYIWTLLKNHEDQKRAKKHVGL